MKVITRAGNTLAVVALMLAMCETYASGQTAPRPLRIGVLLTDAPDDLQRGVAFGIEEVRRSATLIGRDVIVVDIESNGRAPVDAVIVASSRPLREVIGTGGSTPAVLRLVPVVDSMGTVHSRGAGGTASHSPLELTLFPEPGIVAATLAKLPAAPPGVERRVAAWHPSLDRFGAGQLNERFRSKVGAEMSEQAWLGWFAVKVVWDAAARVGVLESKGVALYLSDPARRFDGHKGAALRFDDTGALVQPLYIVERAVGAARWTLSSEVKP